VLFTSDFTTQTLFLLLLIGFAAGFIDSIVGGGGLISTPGLLFLFPTWPILKVIGTNRTSSIFGTSVAAANYFQKVSIPINWILGACASAFSASFLGIQLAKKLDPTVLKWLILTVIAGFAIYTFFKKDLGQTEKLRFSDKKGTFWACVGVGGVCGFYNGFIGPGTGTLLVFGFASFVGFDFLKSSAIAKVANVSGDLSSWMVLLAGGLVVWKAAVPLILSNMLGSFLGSKLAILKGSKFIRVVFLFVVLVLILHQIWIDFDIRHVF
jgi:uncharacterized protein